VLLNYCGAQTHRWSAGGKIQLQNLPSGRKGQSDRLRRSIQAPPGWRFGRVDSSSIEARVAAWLAGEEVLLQSFRTGGDPYVDFASDIYGYPINKRDHPEQRSVGKAGILSLQFGVGVDKFVKTIQAGLSGPAIPDFPHEMGQKAVTLYRSKHQHIIGAWKFLEKVLCRMPSMTPDEVFYFGPNDIIKIEGDRIMMPNDLYIHYPKLRGQDAGNRVEFFYNTRDGVNYIYPSMLFQHLVQSTARSVVAHQILEIAKEIPDIVLLVHDECDFLVREEDADAAVQFAVQCFKTPPGWCADLPLDGEGSHSESYAK
jgi:DNA polymerase